MNYIAEINAFYDWLGANPMKASAIALWHALMSIANGSNWTTEITPAMSTLQSKSGLEKDAVKTARNQLKQAGRIDWKPRGGNRSAVYTIIPFVAEIQPQASPQAPPQPAPQTPPQPPPIYKRNETIRDQKKEKSIKKKLTPPTREEVSAYCRNRGSNVDPDRFYDYFAAADWVDSRGNPVRNWKQKLISWEGRNGTDSNRAAAASAGSGRSSPPRYGHVAGTAVGGALPDAE